VDRILSGSSLDGSKNNLGNAIHQQHSNDTSSFAERKAKRQRLDQEPVSDAGGINSTTSTSSTPVLSNIALSIMQKQGYQLGAGLGADAQGSTSALEVVQRPAGVGLGFSFEERIQQDDKYWWRCNMENFLVIPQQRTSVSATVQFKLVVGAAPIRISHTKFCGEDQFRQLLELRQTTLEQFDRRSFLVHYASVEEFPPLFVSKSMFTERAPNRAALVFAELDREFKIVHTLLKTSAVGAVTPAAAAATSTLDTSIKFADLSSGSLFSTFLGNHFERELVDIFANSEQPRFSSLSILNDRSNSTMAKLESLLSNNVDLLLASDIDIGPVEDDQQPDDIGLVRIDNDTHGENKLLLLHSWLSVVALRRGGCLMIRFTDCFTRFVVGLFHLLQLCFDSVSIVKPAASAPTSAEKWLVCRQFSMRTEDRAPMATFLRAALDRLCELDASGMTVLELVSTNDVARTELPRYVIQRNDVLAARECRALQLLKKATAAAGGATSNLTAATVDEKKFSDFVDSMLTLPVISTGPKKREREE
jgi:hypothetical protein